MNTAGSFADLILLGGHIHTLDPDRPGASAVAVAGGRIIAVGDDLDMSDWRGRRTQTIDLDGASLTPGLVDGHTHPIWGVEFTAGVDLSGCADLAALRAALAGAAAATPGGGSIRGWGLDPNTFGATPITHAAIDDILGGRQAYLVLFDGHSALASSEALHRARIDGPRQFGSRSAIVCDDQQRPTGHLLEEGAMSLVNSVIPAAPAPQRRRRVREILTDMAATGLTGGHVMDANGDSLDLLTALDKAGELPLRLRLAPWCDPETTPRTSRHCWDTATPRAALAGRGSQVVHRRHHRRWHRLAAGPTATASRLAPTGKIRTSTPRRSRPSAGPGCRPRPTPSATPPSITSWTPSRKSVPDCTTRHRIEHIETLPAEQVPRFAQLGVVASMQPSHATDYTRADHSDNWSPARRGAGPPGLALP